MGLLEKIRVGCVIISTTLAFAASTYYVGSYVIQRGEELVRSQSRWYQASEGPNMSRWVDGTSQDLAKAKLAGVFAGVVSGGIAALVVGAGTDSLIKKIAR